MSDAKIIAHLCRTKYARHFCTVPNDSERSGGLETLFRILPCDLILLLQRSGGLGWLAGFRPADYALP
jgi:hypothetical protein